MAPGTAPPGGAMVCVEGFRALSCGLRLPVRFEMVPPSPVLCPPQPRPQGPGDTSAFLELWCWRCGDRGLPAQENVTTQPGSPCPQTRTEWEAPDIPALTQVKLCSASGQKDPRGSPEEAVLLPQVGT